MASWPCSALFVYLLFFSGVAHFKDNRQQEKLALIMLPPTRSIGITPRRDAMTGLHGTGTVTADMKPDMAGIWLYHCHISDHMLAGMVARYEVKAR